MLKVFIIFLLIIIHAYDVKLDATNNVKKLFLECSCLHAQDHNGTSTNPSMVTLNASMVRHAKNNCLVIFITGSNEEIVSVRFRHLLLRSNCLDYVEIFPYLREPVVENTTQPEYVFCNRTRTSTTLSPHSDINKNNNNINNKNVSSPITMSNIGSYPNISFAAATATTTRIMHVDDLPPHEFIYSSGKIFAIRLRFTKPPPPNINDWSMNISAEYRFLKKDNFRNDGRLIPGTYCDYYFFANAEENASNREIWKYFHSPRFPAKYPGLVKCSFKFIGRPETRVEVIIEELHISKKGTSCNLDKLTIFDAESVNMNAVIDVLCGLISRSRHILSSGPDLLIEFNVSSNVTSKGFRGKFKFIQNDIGNGMATDSPIVVGEINSTVKSQINNLLAYNVIENIKISKGFKQGNFLYRVSLNEV